MRSSNHQQHITRRVAHNDCQECRADCERQFLRPQWTRYQFVDKYLAYIKPRLLAINRHQVNTVDAIIWHRDFVKTLHRRITLKGAGETGRKQNGSYRQRLNQFPRSTDQLYLRRYARRGASTLA